MPAVPIAWDAALPDLPLAVLAIACLALVELAKTARWVTLFGPHRPPFPRGLRAVVVGQIANALAPIRAGDAVRVGLVTAEGSPVVPAAAALAGVKALDVLALAAITAAVVGNAAFARGGWTPLAGAGLVVVGALLALRGRAWRPLLERLPFARRLRLGAVVDVAETLRDRRTLYVVVTASALVWLAGLGANALMLLAAGIPPTLDLAARVLVAGYLVGLLPAPPARLGVFEAGVTVALTSAGVPLEAAIVAAVTLHACQLIELGTLLVASLLAGRRPAWRVPYRFLRPSV